MSDIRKGYYVVKFYNHNIRQVMKFNGKNFEGFKSDNFIHDEIEYYIPLSVEHESRHTEPQQVKQGEWVISPTTAEDESTGVLYAVKLKKDSILTIGHYNDSDGYMAVRHGSKVGLNRLNDIYAILEIPPTDTEED